MAQEPDTFIIGGEESGGLTIRGHVPEKDGILACLLVAEMVAMSKKPIKKILAEIEKLVGPVYTDRLNFHINQDAMDDFRARIVKNKPAGFDKFKVKETITLDGYKFILDDGASWIGFRLSGTEPVVRCYLESDSKEKLKKLAAAGKKLVLNGK
jgi:phosphomannomutase